MNPDFSRFQKLPSLDALFASTNLAELGGRPGSHTNVGARRSLFPLPEVEGQGEGKHTATPTLPQRNQPFRA